MESAGHLPVLRRAGTVLLTVGLIDIAFMLYSLVTRTSYSSSLGIFAVVAGVFLQRGSLRAAGAVRWFSVLTLAAVLSVVLAWPLIQPIGLTLAQVRVSPRESIGLLAYVLLLVGLLSWIQRELGKPAVLAAREAAGMKPRSMYVPAAAGVAVVVLLVNSLHFLFQSESGVKAIALAEQQLGPGYQYHVTSLRISKNADGTVVGGVVTAWNDREVRRVPVKWTE